MRSLSRAFVVAIGYTMIPFALGSPGIAHLRAHQSGVDPQDVRSLIEAGRAFDKQGDDARAAVVQAGRSGGDTAALVRSEVQKYEQAIQSYTAAIAKDPKSSEAYRLRGNAYAKRDQDGKSALIMRTVNGLPRVAGAIAEFGPQALTDLDQAVQLAPQDALSFLARGKVLAMQWRNKWSVYIGLSEDDQKAGLVTPDVALARRAVSDFKMATDLNSKLCEAYSESFNLYLLAFHFAEAASNARKANDCDPATTTADKAMLDRLDEFARDPGKIPPALLTGKPDLTVPPPAASASGGSVFTFGRGQSANATIQPGATLQLGAGGQMHARYAFTGDYIASDGAGKSAKLKSGLTFAEVQQALDANGVAWKKKADDALLVGDTTFYFKEGHLTEIEK